MSRPYGGLVSSASLTLITRLIVFGLSLMTNIILARSLGPQGRGIYAVAVLIPSIITLLAALGLGPANVYHLSKRLIDLDDLIGHSTSLALLLGSACFLILLAYLKLSGSSTFAGVAAQYVLVACLSIPFSLLTSFLQGILQGDGRFIRFNVVLLVNYAALLVTLVAAVLLFSERTLGAVAAFTVSTIATTAVAAYCVAPISHFSFRLRRATLRPLLRFGLISYLGSLTSFVNYRFDVLIVNFFAGARQVGLYAVGTGLAEIVWYLANSAAIVLAPRVAASELEDADRLTEQVGRVITALALVAAGVLALLTPFVVVLFFGSAYAESTWAVWLLLPGIVTFSIGKILSTYLLGRNKLKVDLLASFVALVVTIALDFTLIPSYGFRGAAIASSIAYTCGMAVDLFWVLRNSSISPRRLLVPRHSDARLLIARIKEAGWLGMVGVGRTPAPTGESGPGSTSG